MLKLPFIFALFLAFLGLLVAGDQNEKRQEGECTVSLKNGTVTGAITTTLNPDKNLCSYMAIPYASPPVRFQAPQPSTAWEGTLNATSRPNWCPQTGSAPPGVEISENCLYLNVHQPIQQSDDPEGFPVMIYFYGGSYVTGSSDMYNPIKLLARGDVILVVVHYRVGTLGFFSTGDATVPGNNGLKDQAFSIRWASENIAAFGGNPKNIIIFGESAGGSSVVFQLISPLNKGLIHGAIAQSGSALASWSVNRNPGESARIMATRLGCPTSTAEMVTCLNALPWERIIKEQDAFTIESYQTATWPHATMTPVIEPKDTPGAFIAEEPATLMKTGDIPNIPVMLGANKHDGAFVLVKLYLAKFGPQNQDKDAEFMKHQVIPDLLHFVNAPELDTGNRVVASSVELAYLSGVNRSSWEESMSGLVDTCSVFGFKSSIQNTAEILASRNRKVYLYSFEHHSNNTIWDRVVGDNPVPIEGGVTHGDDLIYLFELGKELSENDQIVSDVLCDMWLNFAKFGNPTPSPDARFENWEPYTTSDEAYMKLNATPTVKYGFRDSWRPNGFEWN